MNKKFLAAMLAFVMLLSMSLTVFADETEACDHAGARWVEAPFENVHFLYCDRCGESLSEGEAHSFADGVCGRCGAEAVKEECTHPNLQYQEEKANAETHFVFCYDCGYTDELPHEFEEDTCIKCGYEKKSEETTKLDEVNGVPQTGDTNNMSQWIGMVVLGFAGMAAAYVCGKKRA